VSPTSAATWPPVDTDNTVNSAADMQANKRLRI
jgi:hypothetical protein